MAPSPIALDPGRFEFRQGDSVALSWLEGGQAAPWRSEDVRWLFVRAAGNQSNFDRVGSAPRLSLLLEHAGSTLIGVDALPAVDASGTRHVRSASVIVVVTSGDGDVPPSATAVSKAGLDVEIRPMMDPTSAQVGSDIAFRLYRDGVAQAQRPILVRHLAGGEVQRLVTGPEGFATMRVARAGVWRVETSFTREFSEAAGAVREQASSSLTFSVPEAAR